MNPKYKQLSLIIFVLFSTAACSDNYNEPVRDIYDSKVACAHDWKEENCKEVPKSEITTSSGGFFFYSPAYYQGSRSYNGYTPVTNLASHMHSKSTGIVSKSNFASEYKSSQAARAAAHSSRGGFGGVRGVSAGG